MYRKIGEREGDPQDPSGRAYDILCEMRDAAARTINARLSAAGFDDIPLDALLILAAIDHRNRDLSRGTDGLSRADPHVLAQRLGISDHAETQWIETLTLRGYLEFLDNPDNPDKPTAVATERGRAALRETTAGLRWDRWAEFPQRSDDIVISTEPKSGTTWMQMICALLIFQTTELPASLPELSPWLDERASGINGRSHIYAQLAAQKHRRFIKTHAPLYEIPTDPRVIHIVVARNLFDMVVSLYHQTNNRATGGRGGQSPDTLRQSLLQCIDEIETGHGKFERPLKNLSYAWERRAEPNFVLVHYEDLSADLAGEMRRLAGRLDIVVPESKWPSLVQAATFKQMRETPGLIQPMQYDRPLQGVRPSQAFFRQGSSGEGRSLLTDTDAARFYACAARIAPQGMLAWLHREDESVTQPAK
jgi:aryl sulfotransferase